MAYLSQEGFEVPEAKDFTSAQEVYAKISALQDEYDEICKHLGSLSQCQKIRQQITLLRPIANSLYAQEKRNIRQSASRPGQAINAIHAQDNAAVEGGLV